MNSNVGGWMQTDHRCMAQASRTFLLLNDGRVAVVLIMGGHMHRGTTAVQALLSRRMSSTGQQSTFPPMARPAPKRLPMGPPAFTMHPTPPVRRRPPYPCSPHLFFMQGPMQLRPRQPGAAGRARRWVGGVKEGRGVGICVAAQLGQ